ncbi:iron-containing alcohol dehydrogenase family protein [Actinomycetospora sp. CA-053990]|uniref:iron-containing alcohol dehydrogenase family protein n=1 Tax=Actinomycetospora sp. CA-053990 TaxID=3239891 RepID=UPI003D9445CE
MLVVTDPGLRAAGVVDAVVGPLAASGAVVEVFDAVRGNPTVAVVEDGAEHARALGLDAVLALGGGSSLDAAKGIALLAPSPGARADGSGVTPAAGLPLVAVPTTAGTGAETNGFGVLEDPANRQKVYCGDASVVPRVAVLDPELTLGLPAAATAATGVDALVHGIESLASRGRDPMSEAFAAEAVRRAWVWLPVAVADGSDPRARAEMLVAAHLAGQALTRSGLGLVHGLAHALSLHTGAVHGPALAAVLPEVVAWSLDADPAGWGRAAEAAGLPGPAALPDALGACSSRSTRGSRWPTWVRPPTTARPWRARPWPTRSAATRLGTRRRWPSSWSCSAAADTRSRATRTWARSRIRAPGGGVGPGFEVMQQVSPRSPHSSRSPCVGAVPTVGVVISSGPTGARPAPPGLP